MACAVRAKVSVVVGRRSARLVTFFEEVRMADWSLSQLLASLHEDIQQRLTISCAEF